MQHRVSRREFVRLLSAGSAFVGIGGGATSCLNMSGAPVARILPPPLNANPLRLAQAVVPHELTLLAAPGVADIGGGVQAPAWLLNEALPSPLLRVRRGDRMRVALHNELPDDLILHWHGLTPPEAADGHPRLAVPTGGSYEYDFTVENRAATYWYHSHTHHRTAKHTALGIAGLLIVADAEEEALGLPSGDREVPLILQDRQLDRNGYPVHSYDNVITGYLGDAPFGNGIHRPYLDCDSALYRFRILNGANARIFRLERSDGKPLVLIGNDGGLIERPEPLEYIDVAPAERVDVLVDLRSARVGEEVTIRSRAFVIEGGSEHLLNVAAQGTPMDLLLLRVANRVRDDSRIPDRFPEIHRPDPADAVRERTFEFSTGTDPVTNTMVKHGINGLSYEMDRIDVRVPFNETEIWTFTADSGFAHPVHLHATHFRVLSRSGGRNQVMPWEGGLKDTVLLHPLESVQVAVRFTAHRGLFLLHCHNLEHEDVGMMLNVLVE